MKRMLGLILALTLAGVFAVATQARTEDRSPRRGALHVTKECIGPPAYEGKVGQFCTITSSNIRAIQPGMKVVYLAPLANGVLDSDLALGSGDGTALGHVVLDASTGSGRITFSVGTGRFSGFRADAVVSVDDQGVWHWDGRYSFGRSDDDDDD